MNALRLLHITDTHLYADAAARLAGVDTTASLNAVLETALANQQPDLLLHTGDLAEDPVAATYARFEKLLAQHHAGERCVLPGNHDDPAQAPALFSTPAWASGAWTLLGLDSRIPGDVNGALAASELERLEAALAAVRTPFVLVAVHHPPLGVGWSLDSSAIANGAQLLARLGADQRVRGLVFGHVHQNVDIRVGHLRLLGSPSTCVQFRPLTVEFALDDQPPGYRWIELAEDGTIRTRVERLPAGSFPARLEARQ